MRGGDTIRHALAYAVSEEVLPMRRPLRFQSQQTEDSRRHTDSQEYASGYPGICTAVIGSMTLALKAQNVLAEAAIRASLTKVSSSETHNGCAYGVDFPCVQSGNVRTVLSRAGIRVRQYLSAQSDF